MNRIAREQGSVLVGLLWCLVLVSLLVIGVLHTSRIDLMVVKNYGDRIQAHYLAVAGIEKAKALLYQDARERSQTGRNHSGELYDSPENFRDVPLGRGQFRVFRRGSDDEGGGIVYGVGDEESRLNVNVASLEEMGNLDGMTPDVAAAIMDWRNTGNQTTPGGSTEAAPGGATAEYYTSLQPPSLPRNGPLQTVRELLMVRGVSRDALLGADVHQNGMFEPGEEIGQETSTSDVLDMGWAGILTVDSSVDNVTATGDDPVNVQTADEATLTSVRGITSEIARAIIAYRGQHHFDSIADLLDVTAPQNTGQSGPNLGSNANQGDSGSPDNASGQNQSGSNPSGPKVIGEDLLMDIADSLTVETEKERTGVININTAPIEVLICLPGLTRDLARAIINYRQSSGFLPNTACLLRVPGLTEDILKQVGPRVTARSETYRILCEGEVNSSKVRQRIQEIVHIGLHSTLTVSYREDDL